MARGAQDLPVDLDASLKQNLVGEERRPFGAEPVPGRAPEGGGLRAVRGETRYLWMHTRERRAIVRLTDRVRAAVKESGVTEGFVLVSAMHITAAVYVNDHETGIMQDMMDLLDRLAPPLAGYRHHRTGEDNGDAHLKSLLLHHQVIVPVTGGDLDLGPWQEIFYAEFDGRRRKRVLIKVLGV